ncbi:MAG: aldo/keto reductase [Dermabacter sp.]|nr:aldo/keto reductase [Dermabacter sp.]
MTTSPTLTFHDGHQIPQLGYGVFKVPNDEAATAVAAALAAGYRHIDTAAIYGNEEGVRQGIEASGVDPASIFVTTKLWNADQGYDATLRAFDASMQRLGRDVLDLYLIHWPTPMYGLYNDTWKAFIELQKQGRITSIGVSNFTADALEDLIEVSGVVPVINQVELHPYFNQAQLRETHLKHGIMTEAWGPLGQGGDVLQDPVIADIAAAHGATPGQVILAWHRQIGNVVIPKSVTPSRIVENFESISLELTDEEIERINDLSRADGRVGPDPAEADFR